MSVASDACISGSKREKVFYAVFGFVLPLHLKKFNYFIGGMLTSRASVFILEVAGVSTCSRSLKSHLFREIDAFTWRPFGVMTGASVASAGLKG